MNRSRPQLFRSTRLLLVFPTSPSTFYVIKCGFFFLRGERLALPTLLNVSCDKNTIFRGLILVYSTPRKSVRKVSECSSREWTADRDSSFFFFFRFFAALEARAGFATAVDGPKFLTKSSTLPIQARWCRRAYGGRSGIARKISDFEFSERMKVVSEQKGEGGHARAYDSDTNFDLPEGVLVK